MVRKCHIADALTFVRYPLAALMVVFTIIGVPASWALANFVVGQLTDAFDGIAADKWRYTIEEEKKLWWRIHHRGNDQAADMALGIATLIYVAFRTYSFGEALLWYVLAIGVPLQVFVVYWLLPKWPSIAKAVILARRVAYVLLIAFVVIVLLLAATVSSNLTWDAISESVSFKIWLGAGVAIGLVIAWFKRDRMLHVFRDWWADHVA